MFATGGMDTVYSTGKVFRMKSDVFSINCS